MLLQHNSHLEWKQGLESGLFENIYIYMEEGETFAGVCHSDTGMTGKGKELIIKDD